MSWRRRGGMEGRKDRGTAETGASEGEAGE